MKTNICNTAIIITLITLASVCLASQPADITNPGRHELTFGEAQKTLVSCVINVVQYSDSMLYNRRWGNYGRKPETVIAGMEISVDSRSIRVPLSAYADLSNARSARLEKSTSGYRLVILGGDGIASYDVAIDLSASQVLQRIVRSGEFPEDDWEKTTYSKVETTE
ncbi:MAG: hypothetical protein WAO19_13270 [Candidatus Kryptoniota bacterium]